jgi:hypothetical protein
MNTLLDLARHRQHLTQELARIRRSSMDASARGDFRAVARLTLEAARINAAISETQAKEDAAR